MAYLTHDPMTRAIWPAQPGILYGQYRQRIMPLPKRPMLAAVLER